MNKKKILGLVTGITLALSELTVPSAQAASTNATRWVSADSTGYAWSAENTAAEADIANFVQYFTPKVKLYAITAQAGSTFSFKYHVTNSSGAAVPNTAVTLVINPTYNYPTATLSNPVLDPTKNSDGTNRDPVKTDNADIALMTDANGDVTYSVTNNTPSADAVEAVGSDGKTMYLASAKTFTQFILYVGAFSNVAARLPVQTTQDVDILQVFWVKPVAGVTDVNPHAPAPVATPTPTPTPTATTPPVVVAPNPSIRLTSPVYTSANSVDSTGDIAQYYSPATKAFYTYLAAGSTVSLTYHVTLDGKTAAANKSVELYVDSAYSGSKANWVSGSTKITAPAATDATFGAKLVGVTDANGNVTFKLTNTDTKGLENAPTSPNQDRGAIKPARLFGTIKPVLAGITDDKAEDTDLVTFDIYAGPKAAPASKTITCVKGKASKKVTGAKPVCPKGYTLKK